MEAYQKTKSKTKAAMTNMTEILDKTVDEDGAEGDLTGFMLTGEKGASRRCTNTGYTTTM